MRMVKAVSALFLGLSLITQFNPAQADDGQSKFAVGFNQAWLFNRYGSQWVQGFDSNESQRVLQLAKNANSNIVRFWLFEGFFSDALIWTNDRAVSLNPIFIQNLRVVMQQAKDLGIHLNLTLFDGNMAKAKDIQINRKNYWWNLLNGKYEERSQFISNVFIPLLQVVNDPSFANSKGEQVVSQIDLANEINVFTFSSSGVRFVDGWKGANRFICDFYAAKNSVAPQILQTASIGWGGAVDKILNGDLQPNCVDLFDFHIYDDGGEIDDCEKVANYAHSLGKKIQLGEFGQKWNFGWISPGIAKRDGLQTDITRNFLRNAKSCGLDGAMAWRLAEPESNAYLTYERDGKMRPAYYEFQREAALLNSN